MKVAFITGASSGIGWATAIAFAKSGVHVVGTARRAERLTDLQNEIETLTKPHGNFLGIAGDVTNAQSMQSAVNKVIKRFGQVDILVANAGIGHRGDLVEAEWVDLERLLRTNIDGVLHSVRACVPNMRENGGGHIITISSVAAYTPLPYATIYAASKAFVSSLAKSLRLELEDDNIFVTDFLVGRTATEFNEKRLGKGKRSDSQIPNMTPELVAEAIVRATKQHKKTVTLRLFDRLIVWGSQLMPTVIGRLAKRQYR